MIRLSLWTDLIVVASFAMLLHLCNLFSNIWNFCFICEQAFSRPPELNELGSILEAAIEAAANEIINLREKLNDWDSKVGDGDCGSTVSFIRP